MSRGKHGSTLAAAVILLILTAAVGFALVQSGALAHLTSFKWEPDLALQKVLVTKSNGTSVELLPDSSTKVLSNPEKIKLAQDVADRLDRNAILPERSLLREDRLTNENTISQMLEALAVELGSSELYSLIKTYRENDEIINVSRKQIASNEELAKVSSGDLAAMKTSNPAAAEAISKSQAGSMSSTTEANRKIQIATSENNELAERIAQSLQAQGFPIDAKNVKNLCASPDRNDIIGLAQSFRSIQVITKELELMVLAQPDKNLARKYYATYTVLLMALDKIQKNYMEKIDAVHIPYAKSIIAEAEKTISEAKDALLTDEALDNAQGAAALGLNIKTCEQTIEGARWTILKLEAQRKKLALANKRIGFSIIAARNTHKTLSLQTELAAFMKSSAEELKEVESLSLPEMLVLNFDPKQEGINLIDSRNRPSN
ncbi:MAG: hypothetical protein D4R65_06105 [Verrucomicrobiaceae bacterium]|nr:MAG: hypothetical protein D4R65_06105 [Verrucomicrobiaceae bacterium]